MLPSRALELIIVNISALSWLCYGSLDQRLILEAGEMQVQYIMSHLFFFPDNCYCVDAKGHASTSPYTHICLYDIVKSE